VEKKKNRVVPAKKSRSERKLKEKKAEKSPLLRKLNYYHCKIGVVTLPTGKGRFLGLGKIGRDFSRGKRGGI